ncbi:hypothetical protein BaRGS_00018220, partial [Batillaria attramentaria]
MAGRVCIASAVRDLTKHVKQLLPNVHVEDTHYARGSGVPAEMLSILRETEILLCDGDAFLWCLNNNATPKLKWAQSTWAGVDSVTKAFEYTKPTLDFHLTRPGEAFGAIMAEYVIGQIIAKERGFLRMAEKQQQKEWAMSEFNHFRPLSSLTIGLLGFGAIGKEVARVCKAMGIGVWAVNRTPGKSPSPDVDQFRLIEDLPEVLSSCDYICSILPSTPATRDMLSGDVLKHCQTRGSVLINIGRGSVISDDSLVKAVREGWIKGAILDVFNTEPLPADSPLWSLPNVVISPHVSGPTLPDKSNAPGTDAVNTANSTDVYDMPKLKPDLLNIPSAKPRPSAPVDSQENPKARGLSWAPDVRPRRVPADDSPSGGLPATPTSSASSVYTPKVRTESMYTMRSGVMGQDCDYESLPGCSGNEWSLPESFPTRERAWSTVTVREGVFGGNARTSLTPDLPLNDPRRISMGRFSDDLTCQWAPAEVMDRGRWSTIAVRNGVYGGVRPTSLQAELSAEGSQDRSVPGILKNRKASHKDCSSAKTDSSGPSWISRLLFRTDKTRKDENKYPSTQPAPPPPPSQTQPVWLKVAEPEPTAPSEKMETLRFRLEEIIVDMALIKGSMDQLSHAVILLDDRIRDLTRDVRMLKKYGLMVRMIKFWYALVSSQLSNGHGCHDTTQTSPDTESFPLRGCSLRWNQRLYFP